MGMDSHSSVCFPSWSMQPGNELFYLCETGLGKLESPYVAANDGLRLSYSKVESAGQDSP